MNVCEWVNVMHNLCKAPWIKVLYKCTIYHLIIAMFEWVEKTLSHHSGLAPHPTLNTHTFNVLLKGTNCSRQLDAFCQMFAKHMDALWAVHHTKLANASFTSCVRSPSSVFVSGQMSVQTPLHNPEMFMQETTWPAQNFVCVEVTVNTTQTVMLKMTLRTVTKSCKRIFLNGRSIYF